MIHDTIFKRIAESVLGKCAMAALAVMCCTTAPAQRQTDALSRGTVAVKTKTGVFISWRILAEEYYGVTYNVYRNGTKLNSTPLTVSNYTDASGSATDTYTVAAVLADGTVQSQSASVTPWNTGRVDTSSKVLFPCPAYKEITMQSVYSRDGDDITDNYIINDVSMADLDGDGDIEFIVKRINQADADALFPTTCDYGFTVLEAYEMDGTRLWSIDVGPNMVSGGNHEVNIVAYDWDQDGRAEVLLRGADDMILHKASGSSQTIGTSGVNTRSSISHVSNMTYTNTGNEYLLYLDGETLEPYQVITYPIARGSASDWGDSYGHRSSKYFFGAPYLDGRNPSIFLARGIYTKIEMVAYDVNTSTHALTKRWSWSSGSSGSWYGQGYHNFGIADVDLDGRDEIVYGSMVIDHNGKGLSTTGLGHGDAQHCGDLDPFRPGLEIFACNEDNPGNNFRNATTSEIYYRSTASSDDGRCMAANVTNDYPGCLGASASSGVISLASDAVISSLSNNWSSSTAQPMALNFRIYWDGDLLEETVNSPGTERECIVLKAGSGRIMQTSGVAMCNSTKNTPCAQGDIIGDWREELILRSSDNTALRIYTTTDETSYRIPCLWQDHQYRQSMVWQMLGYNQPPHTSYFLGELEGITAAPPALSMTDRTEISAGSVITSSYNDKQILICNAGSYGIGSDGIEPSVLYVNAPSLVTGSGSNSGITTTKYAIQLGASLSSGTYKGVIGGSTTLVKQGEGELKLTARTHTYTGPTQVWGGTFTFCGTLSNSAVWMNRHTTLISSGGKFPQGVTMEYGSTLHPGWGSSSAGTVTVGALEMHEGSRVVLDMSATSSSCDVLNLTSLTIRTQDWEYGPEYLAPVFQIVSDGTLVGGKYKIGTLTTVSGDLNDIIVECEESSDEMYLMQEDGVLYLVVNDEDSFIPCEGTAYYAQLSNASTYLNLTEGADNNITVTTEQTAIYFESDGNGNYYIKDESGNYVYYPSLKSSNWLLGTSSDSKAAWTITSDGDGGFYLYSVSISGRAMGADYSGLGADGTHVDGRKDPTNTSRKDIRGTYTHWVFGLYGTTKSLQVAMPDEEDVIAEKPVNGDAEQATITGIYNLAGQKLNSLQRGINIVVYSDGRSVETTVK